MKRSFFGGAERVSIANLKARLAHYLRKVRSGEEVVITEHNRPIARIVQLDSPEGLNTLKAKKPFKELAEKKWPPIQSGLEIDSLSFLLEERGER